MSLVRKCGSITDPAIRAVLYHAATLYPDLQ